MYFFAARWEASSPTKVIWFFWRRFDGALWFKTTSRVPNCTGANPVATCKPFPNALQRAEVESWSKNTMPWKYISLLKNEPAVSQHYCRIKVPADSLHRKSIPFILSLNTGCSGNDLKIKRKVFGLGSTKRGIDWHLAAFWYFVSHDLIYCVKESFLNIKDAKSVLLTIKCPISVSTSRLKSTLNSNFTLVNYRQNVPAHGTIEWHGANKGARARFNVKGLM